MNEKKLSQSGVALLMSLGILALLSILGATFAVNMRLMERTTRDFVYDVQARYLAEAGIEYAVAELKKMAKNDFVFECFNPYVQTNRDKIDIPWYDSESKIGVSLPAGNNIEIKAVDTARQINVNNANRILLECIPDVGPVRAGNIVSKRTAMPDNKFLTKQSICLAQDVGKGTFDKIKDYITIDTYIDPNVQDENGNVTIQDRSAININSLIGAVNYNDTTQYEYRIIEEILKKVEDVGDTTAYNIIKALKDTINLKENPNKQINSWKKFNAIIDSVDTSEFTDDGKQKVKDMFNPNRKKPHGTNKSGSKGIPTEFCFHSGGVYEITSIGKISKGGREVAKKPINAIVKIFVLWNMTTKEQFRDNANLETNQDKKAQWVNWWDKCPIDLNKSYNTTYNYVADNTIPDSLKLGYWDDFEEGESDTKDNAYRRSVWKKFDEDVDGTSHDTPLVSPRTIYTISSGRLYAYDSGTSGDWPLVTIGYDIDKGASEDENEKWYCDNFLIKAYLSDDGTSGHYVPYEFLEDETNRERKYDAVTQVLVRAGKFDQNTSVFLSIRDLEKDHTEAEKLTHENEYPTTAAVRIFRGTSNEKTDVNDYYSNKIFKVEGHLGPNINRVKTTIYGQGGVVIGNESLSTALGTNPPGDHRGVGAIGFYCATMPFYLDNVRVIPDVGHYESKYIKDSTITPLPSMPTRYEWGTMWGTTSLSTGADIEKEIVQLNQKTDVKGDDWNVYWIGSDSFDGGCVWRKIDEPDSSNIQFLAVLKSDHLDDNTYEYKEIPVLEDVWITYLPRTRVLYWREN